MDGSNRHFNPNPTLKANFISKAFFCWLNPLFKKGYTETLKEDDLYNVVHSDSSEYLGDELDKAWTEQKKLLKVGKTPSLLKALFKVFGWQYILIGLVVLLEEGTKVIQPLLLGGLIRFFTPDSQVSKEEAYLYAGGVSLCAIMLAVSHHPYFFTVQRIGMRMRIACCSLMYKKCLRLSNKAMGETTVGQIVNLMSNDVNRFDQSVIFLHFLWVGPLQAIAVLAILWHELGPSVLAGFVVLLLLIPVQGFMGKLFSKLRHKTAIHTDERVKVMNEIISGMRVIKMYCWEKPFGDLVERIRKQETDCHKQIYRAFTWKFLLYFTGEKVLGLFTIVPYLMIATHPRVFNLYLLAGYCHVLYLPWCNFMFFAVEAGSTALVSMERIQKFLLLEELEESSDVKKSTLRPKAEDASLEMDKVTAKWEGASEINTLENISLNVKAGQLVAVIGPVGCGKSSLLMSILGELPTQKGNIKVQGSVAYVSQQPWIFSGSVRQNITFGSAFDKARYDKIVKVSALKRDFEIMPNGDQTLIGDRGVSLSGGQRARVSLARALYMDADIYLLDDPLSAVDSAVGRHIFEKCIVGYLRNKPRILVTHQVQFLPVANDIFILKEGKIERSGSFVDLSNSGIDFAELLKVEEEEEPTSPSSLTDLNFSAAPPPEVAEYGSHMSLHSIVDDYEPEAIQLPEQEDMTTGTVGFGVYLEYFKAGTGVFKFVLLVLVNILAQTFYVGSDVWLSIWSNQEEARYAKTVEFERFLFANNISDYSSSNISSNITIPFVDSHFNIGIFSAIIAAVFFFGLVRALLFFKIAVDASQNLHNKMFTRMLRSPITFFDNNPIGRILNRFSKDVGHMDDLLPVTFFDFIQCSLLILGIVLVAAIINPLVFIPTVPLGIMFVITRRYYLRTSRSVKRLEGTTRSPVFSYLSATLQGLHTVRAMHMEQRFMEEFDNYQNKHTEAWFLFLATSRWLAVRLDWLCAGFITAVTFCSVFAADTMSPGLVGLSITYTMTLMGMFQWGVRQSAEVENQMISVERVLEYTKLPMEADLESEEGKKPPPSWPPSGSIDATNVCLRYSPSAPLVLKDLTFQIKGKEKIGIVGRTGAGKSSLITTLFRMVEPTGYIKIDGIDILDIGLHDLRNTIAIIPQDPVLFTGSLRKNLDPFTQHSDEKLWNALDEVRIKDQVRDLPEGLGAEVSEGGINFSVGQRQLICLARAVLRHNKILMIDEATANVDPITDELIQATIRTKFRECTVLTIAHRLHTIMDSDRVMVMDAGQIVEFDEPYSLLKPGKGVFFEMVQQTGKAETEHLLDMAKEASEKRKSIPAIANGISLSTKSSNTKTASPRSDATVHDVSSSLDSQEPDVDATYDISDIETSLRELEPEEAEHLSEQSETATEQTAQPEKASDSADSTVEDLDIGPTDSDEASDRTALLGSTTTTTTPTTASELTSDPTTSNLGISDTATSDPVTSDLMSSIGDQDPLVGADSSTSASVAAEEEGGDDDDDDDENVVLLKSSGKSNDKDSQEDSSIDV